MWLSTIVVLGCLSASEAPPDDGGADGAVTAPTDPRADAPGTTAADADDAERVDAAPPTSGPAGAEDGAAPASTPADAPPSTEAPPDDAPALTPEEEAAILRAVGADAAATTGPPPPSAVPAPANLAVGRLLQSMNPDLSLILDVAGAWFSDDENLQTGGHDPLATGFTLQQLELHVGSSVDPFFRFDANIVFAQFGVEVEEAYATTLSLPFQLQARFGQFLTRFGRVNPTHPHSWSFADQPLVNGKLFGSEGNRGLGAELSWLAPLPWYVELVGSTTGAAGECCARSFFGADDLGVRSPADLLATVAVKQFFPFTDDLSLAWGLSGQSGPNPTGRGNRTEIAGTDVYLRYRPVSSSNRTAVWLQGEAMVRRRQVPDDVLTDAGFYAQVVGQFLLQWEVGLRVEGVTGVPGDPLDPAYSGLRTRTTLQGTYYPSHFSRVRVQAAYGTPGDGDAPVLATLVDRPVWSLFLALEFLVGAHGAHGF